MATFNLEEFNKNLTDKKKQVEAAFNTKADKAENGLFYKFRDGTNMIRVLPRVENGKWVNDELPWVPTHVHFRIGTGTPFQCIKVTEAGATCPACDYAWSLFETAKNNDDKEAMKAAKDLLPSWNSFGCWVLDLNPDSKDKTKPLWYSCGQKHTDAMIAQIQLSAKLKSKNKYDGSPFFSHATEGQILIVERDASKAKDKQMACEYSVENDEIHVLEGIEPSDVPSMEEVYPILSRDEVRLRVAEAQDKVSEANSSSGEERRGSSDKVADKVASVLTKVGKKTAVIPEAIDDGDAEF